MDEGKGETVLMVHGNPTWSFYFRNVVKALSPDYRCIVPDHMGMGLSARPDDKHYAYTLQSRVDDLDKLMAHAAPSGPVTLIVHDWGGMIGMSWAVRHPERIKAIVALNTGCFRLPEEKPFPPGLTVMRGALTGIPLRLSAFFRRTVLRSCTNKVKLDEATMAGYHDPYDGWKESRAVHRFVQDIPLQPSDPAWKVVVDTESKLFLLKEVPMLLPWGLRDWVFDEAFLNGWIKRFPKAQVKRFEDCGHFLLEDARDEVIPLIKGFVAGAAVRA
ncbi:MAG: alpha/beta fold hydrolase [Elusimicrobiota bacterium]|nr:MAG: alpha/beta fold hydrolase [Elusimicrobiota bacterium]